MTLMEVGVPFITKRAKARQFIILRANEFGERIPLTITGYDREGDTITIIFQKVGKTTLLLDQLEGGDGILDFIGLLGTTPHLDRYKKAAVIGSGTGCTAAYPQAKALHEMGAHVDMIADFRSQDIIILKDEMHAVSNNLFLMTDDGSNDSKGLVTDTLKAQIDADTDYDLVVAIGPLPVIRAVSNLTRPYGIKTIVNMNPAMIDGTGMCGGCRIVVGGETKFVCVDGPDFDGYLVDLDEAIFHTRTYREDEARATRGYNCRLMEGARNGQHESEKNINVGTGSAGAQS